MLKIDTQTSAFIAHIFVFMPVLLETFPVASFPRRHAQVSVSLRSFSHAQSHKVTHAHALARSSAYSHDGQSGTGCVPKHCSELVWRVALIHPALRPAHPRRPGGGLPPRPPSSPGAAAAACQRPPDAPQPPPPPGAELGVGDGAGRLPAEEVRAAAADAVGWGRGPPGQPRQCRRSAVDRGGGGCGVAGLRKFSGSHHTRT